MRDIPAITDPMGRHWKQPTREAILVDDKHALMTVATLEELPNYSGSVPSGTYAGKMWRCALHYKEQGPGDRWYLRWYCDSDQPGMIDIETRPILIVE